MPLLSHSVNKSQILDVGEDFLRFGHKRSFLAAILEPITAGITVLIGCVSLILGVVFIESFFAQDCSPWIAIPLGLCFLWCAGVSFTFLPRMTKKGISTTLTSENGLITLMRTHTCAFRLQRREDLTFPANECRLQILADGSENTDGPSCKLALVHVPTSAQVDLTAWMRPSHPTSQNVASLRQWAEEIAGVVKEAHLFAEIEFVGDWS